MNDPTAASSSSPGAARRWPPLGPPLVALGICLLLLYMVVTALGFSIFRVRLNPLLFGTATLLAAVIVLAKEVRGFLRVRSEVAAGASGADAADALGVEGGYFERGEVVGLFWFAALVALFFLLGFMIGMTTFLVLFLQFYGRESWRMTLGLTVGTMTTLYYLFIEFLGVRVYPGTFDIPLPFGL